MNQDRPNPIGLRLTSSEKMLWQTTAKENGFNTLTKFIKASVEYIINNPESLSLEPRPKAIFSKFEESNLLVQKLINKLENTAPQKAVPLERMESKIDLILKAQNIFPDSENSGVFD
ncbi:MAG: hypothetical protein KJI71_05825 [Patescibacteria group bacterium]|nr:hypothetical protein [Patescibacteria group bacterium]